MDDFDQFWQCYPKKVSKGDARKAWQQTSSIRPPIAELLIAVENGKRSVQWHKADREGNIGAFIPHPSTYLRSEGWENEYTIKLSSIGSTAPYVAPPAPVKPTPEEHARSREIAMKALASVKLRSVG